MSDEREHPDRTTPATSPASVRDHLANERTLLAWVRTALTIIGLGFIVGRLLVEEDAAADPFLTVASVVLVLLGGLAAILAAARFLRTQREIDAAEFAPASRLDVLLAGAVAVAAVVLALYLVVGR
jgi:putative membrane protein